MAIGQLNLSTNYRVCDSNCHCAGIPNHRVWIRVRVRVGLRVRLRVGLRVGLRVEVRVGIGVVLL